MVLSTEWSQIEIIDLINDGSGLGFGIVGGRSTGVVVKSILPGGIADRDGRLQSGDHILQIGDVYTMGFASENVATLLRQSSAQVHLIVARPVDSTSCDYRTVNSHAPIVPTKVISNPEELNTLLLQNGYVENSETPTPDEGEYSQMIGSSLEQNEVIQDVKEITPKFSEEMNSVITKVPSLSFIEIHLPESETIKVVLEKNEYGLGITVAGYVWEREDLSGIFVKSISKGSAADLNENICINDRICEVNDIDLREKTNHEAVEILKSAGSKITLTLERYLRGPRYEHLQNAIQTTYTACRTVSPPSPSITTLSWIPAQTDATYTEIEPEAESFATIDSGMLEPQDPETIEVFVDKHFESGSVTPDADAAIKRKWEAIIGLDAHIVVTQLRKLRGLGISLEGTVDVEDGIELRPRHFIRSILPEGPVGLDGILTSGDELLEVNGQRLVGNSHVEVVKILRELPETVRIVCARSQAEDNLKVIDTGQDMKAFAARNILGNCIQSLIPNKKHMSADSLSNTSSTATLAEDNVEENKSNQVALINDSKLETVILIHNISNSCDSVIKTNINESSNISNSSNNIHDNPDSSINNVNKEKSVNNDSETITISTINNDAEAVNAIDNINTIYIESERMNALNQLNNDVEKVKTINYINKDTDTASEQVAEPRKDSASYLQLEEITDYHSKIDKNLIDDEKIIQETQEIEESESQSNDINNRNKIEQDEETTTKHDNLNNNNNHIANELTPTEYQMNSKNKNLEFDGLFEKITNASETDIISDIIEESNATDNIKFRRQKQKSEKCSNNGMMEKCDKRKSRSLDNVTYLAVWKDEVEYVELHKGPNGLGFAILDYQDPIDPSGTVIVIRTLVPNGPAELSGKLKPGYRIMSVNNTSLKRASLETAVKELKGASLGIVVIGYSKPAPLFSNSDNESPKSLKDSFFIW